MRTLGFRRSVDHARAPLLQDNSTEDDNEDAQLLTVHVRNAMSMLGQLMEYTTLHLSPPGLSAFCSMPRPDRWLSHTSNECGRWSRSSSRPTIHPTEILVRNW